MQRTLQGVLQHRDDDAAQRADTLGPARPQPPCPRDPLDALHQLRGDAERHRHGDAELVEGGGQDPQGALGVGEGVGGTDAADQTGQPQPVEGRREGGLQGDRAADLNARVPGGGGDVREREQQVVVRGDAGREDAAEDHPDRHDGEGQPQVVPEAARPRGVGATGGDHEAQHREDEQEQQRIGGAAGRSRQGERPGPPGERVQVPRTAPAPREPPGGGGRGAGGALVERGHPITRPVDGGAAR